MCSKSIREGLRAGAGPYRVIDQRQNTSAISPSAGWLSIMEGIWGGSMRARQGVKTAGDAREGSSQLFTPWPLCSYLWLLEATAPHRCCLFLTPPHSVGEGQWDETGEIGEWTHHGLCGVLEPVPWNYLSVCRTISGRSPA